MPSPSKPLFSLTGGTGFIGSRVMERLCHDGWNVRALVRNGRKARALVDHWDAAAARNVEFLEGDLISGTPQERMKLFGECLAGASVLIHLGEAKTREKNFDAKNIRTFGLLLEAAHAESGLLRFVFVSAFMAGGLPLPLPSTLTEEMTGVEFPDPYYQWKRIAERLLIKASGKSHYAYTIVRPALVYGPGAEWLVPMLRIIRGAGRFMIPFPGRGSARLGTVHVEDVASTIALCGLSKEAENQIVHAVDEGGRTYLDWFETIAKSTGWRLNIGSVPRRLVFSLARLSDTLISLVGLRYGAHLWARVLAEGCGYSNEKMKKIIGPLRFPTTREGIPGMMEWFAKRSA